MFQLCRREGGLLYLILSKFTYFEPSTASFFSIKKLLRSERKWWPPFINIVLPSTFNFLPGYIILFPSKIESFGWFSPDIATTMFVGNFIGIVCARSLHYQFYSWWVLVDISVLSSFPDSLQLLWTGVFSSIPSTTDSLDIYYTNSMVMTSTGTSTASHTYCGRQPSQHFCGNIPFPDHLP